MSVIDAAMGASQRAEQGGDLAGAAAALQAIADAPGFWGAPALRLAWMRLRLGARDQAEALAFEILSRNPADMAPWALILHGLRLEAAPSAGPWAALLASLRQAQGPMPASLRAGAILALIDQVPADAAALVARLEAAGVLGAAEALALQDGLGLLAAVEAALAAAGGQGPGRWSLGMRPGAAPLGQEAQTLWLNSRWFHRRAAVAGWSWPLAQAWAARLVRALGREAFHDRVALTAPAGIGPADLSAALVEVLLLAALLEATGRDPDLRPAGRAADFAPGSLWLRAGRVELWALCTLAEDAPAQRRAAAQAAQQAQSCRATPEGFCDDSFWWPRRDALANAVYLSTNAGWYAAPETAEASFMDWAGRYLAALGAGKLLAECAEIHQRLACHRPEHAARPLHDWDDPAFARALSGRRVVFVTAFAEAAQQQFDRGAVARLWAGAGLPPPPAALTCLAAPMSIWPYAPDRDWSASFAALASRTAQALRQSGATHLLASCGCYGLPLVHALHQAQPGLTAIYNGHASNAWFGVLTQDARGSFLHARTQASPDWRAGGLEGRYPEVQGIDAGRYASGPA